MHAAQSRLSMLFLEAMPPVVAVTILVAAATVILVRALPPVVPSLWPLSVVWLAPVSHVPAASPLGPSVPIQPTRSSSVGAGVAVGVVVGVVFFPRLYADLKKAGDRIETSTTPTSTQT